MPGMGPLAFANAVFGTTAGLEEGVLFDAALVRLAAAITSISSGGNITFSSGVAQTVETFSTSGTLSVSGISAIVCSSSPNAFAYTLPLPVVSGLSKTIANITGTTSGTATVTVATGGKFTGAGAGTVLTFTSQASAALMSTTSSQWAIVTMSTLCTVA